MLQLLCGIPYTVEYTIALFVRECRRKRRAETHRIPPSRRPQCASCCGSGCARRRRATSTGCARSHRGIVHEMQEECNHHSASQHASTRLVDASGVRRQESGAEQRSSRAHLVLRKTCPTRLQGAMSTLPPHIQMRNDISRFSPPQISIPARATRDRELSERATLDIATDKPLECSQSPSPLIQPLELTSSRAPSGERRAP